MSASPDSHGPHTPEAAAAEWFALKRSGAMTAQEARALEVWLALDPDHRAAFDNLEHYWVVADAVRNDPAVLAMRDAAGRAHGLSRRGVLLGGALAASAAGVAAVAGSGLLRWPFAASQQSFHTAVGQTTTVMLPDGSAVTLDTDSLIHTRLTGARRLIELKRGRAFFRVAHDRSRPFVVMAAGRTVTALGTAFDVRADPRRFEVTLVEGRVRVEGPVQGADRHPPQATEMTAGSQLVARDTRRWTVAETDTARATSWLNGRLAFDNEPLGEVVAEMNRYSDKKIVVADASVAASPIFGVFKAGDVDAFVKAAQAYRLAGVGADTHDEVVLTAPE